MFPVTVVEVYIGIVNVSGLLDVDLETAAVFSTVQLLTTDLYTPTCRNIVIARVVGSMSEFKQAIGRGTRVRDDYGKLWFNIIDYTGSATRLFADPAFDGDPAHLTEEVLAAGGRVSVVSEDSPPFDPDEDDKGVVISDPPPDERRK